MVTDKPDIVQARINAAKTVAVVFVCMLLFMAGAYVLNMMSPKADAKYQVTGTLENNQPFYVLLIGSDSRVGTALYTGKAEDHAQTNQHSDVMTLVRVDPENYIITLVTVPRDTQLSGSSGKINDALLDGDPKKVVEAVQLLTGVSADFYLMTTFTAYEQLVDTLGGVTVDVPQKITVPDPLTAKNLTVLPGRDQQLSGPKALVLARARKEYGDNQDALRQVNVRNLEAAMILKVAQGEKSAEAAVEDLRENTTTNMDWAQVKRLIVEFCNTDQAITIYTCTGPYNGYENADGLWVVPEDTATWTVLMQEVAAGNNPSGVVPAPTFATD